MVQLKAGDRIDCRIKSSTIVSPYRDYDEVRTFEVVSVDKHGCYLFVPPYVMIKESFKADKSGCRNLGIDLKFLGEQIVYVQDNMIYQVSSILDGMACINCQEFCPMASANRGDGTFVCWACRNDPYR